MRKLRLLDMKILAELMRNAKSSDRQIAKKLGRSQPTITRRRTRLERELSLRYTAIPDWVGLGFQLIAFTFAQWKHRMFPKEKMLEAVAFISKHPNIIFVSGGRGMSADRVCVSIHKSYRDYWQLLQAIRLQWGKYLETLGSFITSFGGDEILRPITLQFLADYLAHMEE